MLPVLSRKMLAESWACGSWCADLVVLLAVGARWSQIQALKGAGLLPRPTVIQRQGLRSLLRPSRVVHNALAVMAPSRILGRGSSSFSSPIGVSAAAVSSSASLAVAGTWKGFSVFFPQGCFLQSFFV